LGVLIHYTSRTWNEGTPNPRNISGSINLFHPSSPMYKNSLNSTVWMSFKSQQQKRYCLTTLAVRPSRTDVRRQYSPPVLIAQTNNKYANNVDTTTTAKVTCDRSWNKKNNSAILCRIDVKWYINFLTFFLVLFFIRVEMLSQQCKLLRFRLAYSMHITSGSLTHSNKNNFVEIASCDSRIVWNKHDASIREQLQHFPGR